MTTTSNAPEFRQVPVRTAKQIVDQTEELAALLMRQFYQRQPTVASTVFRDSECPRAQHVWRTACEIQGLLTDTDPEDALSELGDEVAPEESYTGEPGFIVIQEGGSSAELYAHCFDTADQAEAYRTSCADQASYRTSNPIAVPSELLDHPAFQAVAKQIAEGAINVDYPNED